jgi:DNA-binding response OmpR family regulator
VRVLVIEDYPPTRKAVVKALREEGYVVDEAAEGTEGLKLAEAGGHDIIVLDLMLPGLDGLELLRRLRNGGHATHVLVLTARHSVPDRIRGLDLGADDYLVKPFAIEELLARVRALVRREYRSKAPSIRVGHMEINTSNHQVLVDGVPVELTAREYTLLEYLALRAGQIVSRTDILEHLYGGASAASNVVDVYVGYLRRKIETPGRPRLIHTRRGEGYFLADGST